MKKLVFVYGTLKSGFWNNDLLKDSKLVSKAMTKEEFVLTNSGFPYMIRQDAHTAAVGVPTLPVLGELYRVTSEKVMHALDFLEGVGCGHYQHHEIEVEDIETGETQTALAYVPCESDRVVEYPLCETQQINDQLCYEWS